MNTDRELETLRELKRLCELGIDLIESGALVRDPNSSAAPYDFRIGNFALAKNWYPQRTPTKKPCDE